MPWVRFDDGYLSSAKLSKLSTSAICLDMAGIIYAARELRDGHLSNRDVLVLEQLLDIKSFPKVARELVDAQRWDVEGDGFAIHDYLDYQPSREEVMAKREKDRDRKSGRKPNGRQPEIHRKNGGPPPDSGRIPAAPDPDPDPDRNPNDAAGAGPGRARARGDGGFQPIGAFLGGPQRRRRRKISSDDELPAEVIERLKQPPIDLARAQAEAAHAVG